MKKKQKQQASLNLLNQIVTNLYKATFTFQALSFQIYHCIKAGALKVYLSLFFNLGH